MREAAVLWVGVEGVDAGGAGRAWSAWQEALRASGGEAFGPLRSGPGGAWVSVSSWSTGEAAKAAWASFVTSAAWRRVVAGVACQPRVHVASSDGRPWSVAGAGPWLGFEVTADATVETRADRRGADRPESALEALAVPSFEGGVAWSVVGHPGRLVGVVEASRWEAVAPLLEAARGPWVEGPFVVGM